MGSHLTVIGWWMIRTGKPDCRWDSPSACSAAVIDRLVEKPYACLSHSDLLQLKRWNTPTIYNGWEQITRHDAGRRGFQPEECRDFMPHMGPMVGYAVTLQIQPGNPEHKRATRTLPANTAAM